MQKPKLVPQSKVRRVARFAPPSEPNGFSRFLESAREVLFEHDGRKRWIRIGVEHETATAS